MNLIDSLLISLVLLLFPLLIHLFYLAYIKNMNKEYSNTFLDFAIFSSLYLFYSYCKIENHYEFLIFLNIPLIIAFIKKRSFVSVILSISIILIYKYNFDISVHVLILEYIVYFLIYYLCLKEKKNTFLTTLMFVYMNVIVSILTFFIRENSSVEELLINMTTIILFACFSHLIWYIFKVGENIISLHMTVKQLENEKQIRDSLFKITHEIKNPIAVCKTYLDMFNFDNAEHRKYIPIVREEIEKTLLLLQDFLCMNKIKIEKEILDINLLLEDIIFQFEPVMKGNNINFKYNIDDTEIYIEGDYNRLSQVLTNMIKNAIEAVDKCNPVIKIATEILDKQIKIIIVDNGTGISDEDFIKIKEPFYTTKKNGTGLGVSLSCEIIESHDGTIDYYTSYGFWTKVVIILNTIELD